MGSPALGAGPSSQRLEWSTVAAASCRCLLVERSWVTASFTVMMSRTIARWAFYGRGQAMMTLEVVRTLAHWVSVGGSDEEMWVILKEAIGGLLP